MCHASPALLSLAFIGGVLGGCLFLYVAVRVFGFAGLVIAGLAVTAVIVWMFIYVHQLAGC